MSEAKAPAKYMPERITKEFILVGGLKLGLMEPRVGDVEGKTSIELLALMLQEMKGDKSYAAMPVDKKKSILMGMNSVISTTIIGKMNELLEEVPEVKKDSMKPEDVVASLFNDNKLSRNVTFIHSERKLKVVLESPLTSKMKSLATDVDAIALYCSDIGGQSKSDMSAEEWLEIVKSIPYLLGKNILDEYQSMFDLARKYLLDGKELKEGVENF